MKSGESPIWCAAIDVVRFVTSCRTSPKSVATSWRIEFREELVVERLDKTPRWLRLVTSLRAINTPLVPQLRPTLAYRLRIFTAIDRFPIKSICTISLSLATVLSLKGY